MIWNRFKKFYDFGWIVGSVLLVIGLYPLYKEMIPQVVSGNCIRVTNDFFYLSSFIRGHSIDLV